MEAPGSPGRIDENNPLATFGLNQQEPQAPVFISPVLEDSPANRELFKCKNCDGSGRILKKYHLGRSSVKVPEKCPNCDGLGKE